MNSLLFLLKHSGASKRAFLIGVAGKIVSEALPMLHWLLLFHFLLSGESFNLIIMCFISVFVIAGQWLFGQSAKHAFLGAFEITHQLRKVLLLDIRKQPLSLLIGKKLGERIRLVTSDLKNIEDVFSHLDVYKRQAP